MRHFIFQVEHSRKEGPPTGGGAPKILRLRQGGHRKFWASANEDPRPPQDVNSVTSLIPPRHLHDGHDGYEMMGKVFNVLMMTIQCQDDEEEIPPHLQGHFLAITGKLRDVC